MSMDLEKTLSSKELIKCCNCNCCSKDWIRSVKRKFNELEDDNQLVEFDFSSGARVNIENECDALRETVDSQQQSIQDLYEELEEERNASSSATNEAMSMILRLQREKAEIHMDLRQFKNFAEEKMSHDEQEILALEDLLYKREQLIESLTCELEAYKHKMMSYGFSETDASFNRIMADEDQTEDPIYGYYPPLKCNINEAHDALEMDNDAEDVEKYAFGETPHNQEDMNNLDNIISEMERSSSTNQIDEDSSLSKNIVEKVIVDQSPKHHSRHSKRFSDASSSSFLDFSRESPRPGSTVEKKEYVSQMKTNPPNLKKSDNESEIEDDMSDRVYTIDSIHNGVPYKNDTESTTSAGVIEDRATVARESDPDIMKLYARLQSLEADRESMKQTMISMRTEEAQSLLIKEIAQQLCKEMTPERHMPVVKPSLFGGFSFMSIIKWTVGFVSWRNLIRRNKHTFGLSTKNAGLLMLLDKAPRVRHLRYLPSTQVYIHPSLC